MSQEQKTLSALYIEDEAAWRDKHVELLRKGDLAGVDVENMIAFLTEMREYEDFDAENRMRRLLADLLEWQFNEGSRCDELVACIEEQRDAFGFMSPTLIAKLKDQISFTYRLAIESMPRAAHMKPVFPALLPYSVDEALAKGFFPGPATRSGQTAAASC